MNKTNKILLGVCAVLLIVSIVLVGAVFARFANRRLDGDTAINAADFYFESNYLRSIKGTYYLNADTSSVTVELYNYLDELRISEVAISYTVTVETDDEDFSFTPGQRVTEQTRVAAANTKTTTFITLDGLKNGCYYTVTATANGGYTQTLSATFKVDQSSDKCGWEVTEEDHYVILTVWMGSSAGQVEFTVPAGLIPDETDPFLANDENYTILNGVPTYTDSMDAYTSRLYRFFKQDGYDAANAFQVTINETIDNNT